MSWLERADLEHVGVHGVVAPLGLVLSLLVWPDLGPDGWLFAAVISALWVEGVDIVRKRAVTLQEARDLAFRTLGAVSGWAVAAVLNLVL